MEGYVEGQWSLRSEIFSLLKTKTVVHVRLFKKSPAGELMREVCESNRGHVDTVTPMPDTDASGDGDHSVPVGRTEAAAGETSQGGIRGHADTVTPLTYVGASGDGDRHSSASRNEDEGPAAKKQRQACSS